MTETGLKFEEMGIANVLARHQLSTPLHQRSYAWELNEIEKLFQDILKAFNAGEKIYFLGTILLSVDAKSQLLISDGQQRLATISIFISAIRDYLQELKDTDGAKKYEEQFLLDYDVRKKDYKAKLLLNFQDNVYFFERILKPVGRKTEYTGSSFLSHQRLKAAYEYSQSYIRKIMEALAEKDKAERVYDLVDYLQKSVKVIVITVSGQVGNSYKMFETMNARGAPATQIDILKNLVFNLGNEKIHDIHLRWVAMVGIIESLGDDELLLTFIRHFWISRHGATTEGELGETIEKAITSERLAVDFVMSMSAAAVDYIAILNPLQHPRWNDYSRDTRICLNTIISDLKGKQIRPLLLAVTNKFPVNEAEKAFSLLLSASVRFLIAGAAGGLESVYSRFAVAVSRGEITTAKKLREAMAESVPKDEEFKQSFAVASVKRDFLARYYLRALELHVKGEKKPQLLPSEDTTAVNLEHILPVTPSDAWKISDEMAEAYYKRIGNMVLLNAKENVGIGNKAFDEKKPIFKRSPFALTAEIAKNTQWTPAEIEARQKQLAELAPKVWPL